MLLEELDGAQAMGDVRLLESGLEMICSKARESGRRRVTP